MVKSIMNAVYVAIGLAFARKIYEKACSDPYENLPRSHGILKQRPGFSYHDLDMIMGKPDAGKSIIKTIMETSRNIEHGKMGVVPMFSSTPNTDGPWRHLLGVKDILKG